MSNSIFDKHLTLFGKALNLRSKRNTIIASNIANRETPGYRAKDLVFDKELENALYSDRPGPLKTTDSRHFDGINRSPLELVTGRQINSFNPDPGMDGNTVNIEKEMSKLAENKIMYDSLVQMTNYKFRLLKSAITEGGK